MIGSNYIGSSESFSLRSSSRLKSVLMSILFLSAVFFSGAPIDAFAGTEAQGPELVAPVEENNEQPSLLEMISPNNNDDTLNDTNPIGDEEGDEDNNAEGNDENVESVPALSNSGDSTLQKTLERLGYGDREDGINKIHDELFAEGATRKDDPEAMPLIRLVSRIVGTDVYLNRTPDAQPQSGYENSDYNCNINDPDSGTLLYHNCDIPGMGTGLKQSITSMFQSQGVRGANVSNSTSILGFGLPSRIPNGEVPNDYRSGGIKYTALEVIGYNLKFTSYGGEWDNIKITNEARMLKNFGGMDKFKVGTKSVFDASVAVIKGRSGVGQALLDGDPLRAAATFYTLPANAAAEGIETVMDTSDLNVFNTVGWYRADFGKTLYNAREKTRDEMADTISQNIRVLASGVDSSEDLPELPVRFQLIDEPPAFGEPISSCVIDGEEYSTEDKAPGLTEENCKSRFAEIERSDPGTEHTYSYSVDGLAKGETISGWYEKNKSLFDLAEEYGVFRSDNTGGCTFSKTAETIDMEKFRVCWKEAWEEKRRELENGVVVEADREKVLENFRNDPRLNYNAPWNRFVCTTLGDQEPNLFEYNGSRFEQIDGCGPTRPTIQGGLSGDGYPTDSLNYITEGPGEGTAVPVDTRREIMAEAPGIMSAPKEGAIKILFSLNKVFTKITVSIIDLSYSPLLKFIGIDDVMVSFVESLRDSMFFPLIAISMALSALYILIRAISSNRYGKGLKDFALATLSFMVGVFFLLYPAQALRAVDTLPTEVEGAVSDVIFAVNAGSGDLCSATGSAAAIADLPGVSSNYMSATRQIECELWRGMLFEPYVRAQWGDSYDQLYADGVKNLPKGGDVIEVSDETSRLVGDATVGLGGGVTVNNWALYQADILSAGTATNKASEDVVNKESRDIYRIVDLQAGPNGGEGRNAEHFSSWAGTDLSQRLGIVAMSTITSAFAMVAFSSIALIKLEMTIVSILMIMLLPFVMLIAPHPTFGRRKTAKYVATIVTLMLQRVFLVVIIAVMLSFYVAVANASTGALVTLVFTLALTITFMKYRSEILGYLKVGQGANGATLSSKIRQRYIPYRYREMANSAGRIVRQSTVGSAIGTAIGLKTGTPGEGIRGRIKSSAKGMVSGGVEGAKFQTSKERRKLAGSGIKLGGPIVHGYERTSDIIQRIEEVKDRRRQPIIQSLNDEARANAVKVFNEAKAKGVNVDDEDLERMSSANIVPSNDAALNRLVDKVVDYDAKIDKAENALVKIIKNAEANAAGKTIPEVERLKRGGPKNVPVIEEEWDKYADIILSAQSGDISNFVGREEYKAAILLIDHLNQKKAETMELVRERAFLGESRKPTEQISDVLSDLNAQFDAISVISRGKERDVKTYYKDSDSLDEDALKYRTPIINKYSEERSKPRTTATQKSAIRREQRKYYNETINRLQDKIQNASNEGSPQVAPEGTANEGGNNEKGN